MREEHEPLRWHRRLEAQVVAGIGLLIACSLFAVLAATTRVIHLRSLERAARDLDAAHTAFEALTADQADDAAAQASLVASLPVFRAHMTDSRLASDAATLEAMSEEYRQQLGADIFIVTNAAGQWTSQVGWPDGAEPQSAHAWIDEARAGRPHRSIAVLGSRLFLIVSAPARFADEVLGTLTVGFALDDVVATQLARLAQGDVNLVIGRELFASSLTGSGRSAMEALLRQGRIGSSPRPESIGGSDYIAGWFPLTVDGRSSAAGRVILLHDWRQTEEFVDQVRYRVLAAGLIIFVLAVGSGIVFSRRMAAPLQELADAARDIAGGNWKRQVTARGNAEAVVLARAFNEMTAGLRHWYDEARRRDDQLRQTQKMEAIGRLAGGVAHDFNNLLTAILGYAESLAIRRELSVDGRRDVDEIVKAGQSAASLTRQLLAFSRRQVIEPTVLDLKAVVERLQGLIARLIGEDIELDCQFGDNLHAVKADAGQLDQIVMNLVVNARDAMPRGGRLIIEAQNVELSGEPVPREHCTASGPHVMLAVTDNGVGMDDTVKARLFEPFFTTKDRDKGTGLGLATVFGIVRQSGGFISVYSEPGVGSTFKIYLPAVSEKATVQAPAVSTVDLRGTETLLVVEDQPAILSLVHRMLVRHGYTVLGARHPEEALLRFNAHPGAIDLLITDVILPGMNGLQLAQKLREKHPGLRVLYMSGYTEHAAVQQDILEPGVAFLQKPFTPNGLAERVRQVLSAEDLRAAAGAAM